MSKSHSATALRLLASASVIATLASVPSVAFAQDAVEEVADDNRIVVTATKREQDLQDVSLAISAFEGETLADNQINTLEDLQVAVPSLTVGNDFAFAKLYIRGIGLNSSLPGLDPSVALHVDGAVVAQPTQQFASLYDLERVEVLRGPQGTLYGRNATGGSINLVTAAPTDYFEGYTRLTVSGDDFGILAEGAVSGPLTDGIQARIAFRHQNRDGFGTHTLTGEDVDDANKIGIRGQLNFDISPAVTNRVIVEYFRENERSRAVKFLGASFPQTVIDGLPAQIATLSSNQPGVSDTDYRNGLLAQIPNLVTLAGPDALLNSRDVGGDLPPIGRLETTSVTNLFEAELGADFVFRSITNFREGESFLLQDFDISNVRNGIDNALPSTVQVQQVENEQFSQELQFVVDTSRLRGLIGAFYFTDDVSAIVPIGTNPQSAYNRRDILDPFIAQTNPGPAPAARPDIAQLFPDARVMIPGAMDVEAWALFANFTFDVTDTFRIKAGARYSDESRDIQVDTFLPGAGPGLQLATGADSRSFSDFTPEIGLELDVGETLLYATYSEGFKSGSAALVDGSPFITNPETIENWEAGLKGTYLDGALDLSIAAFYYEVDGAQFDRTRLISSGPRFVTSVENAATTEGMGIEIEGTAYLTDEFSLAFNGSLYDIEFQDFITDNPLDPLGALEGLAGFTPRTINLSGNRPRNTPEASFGLRATYDKDLSNGGNITASASYSYTGDQFYTEFNDPRMAADDYSIVDANLKYTFPNRDLSVNLWVRNLTDEFVVSGAFAVSTSRTITGTYLPPRQYGITVGYEF
ncbi:TonB-dependent receptor [Aurantiacibacter sp. MUD11]|uniref:TonB-dependent receptor n=1 Tax=Aurantiacibacter sp. MUD11 TaxID=3003265 RepID=UPI0022AA7D5D|nr:TonB-dependent receptor [Aurantiacibacter sp. MUD11]WAT18605.1 TonB-dependent receptor [Aurantiacibacter sp. MUD11]